MSYLLGDSTDSGLKFNYLDFTKEVIECAAVLVEAELELVATNAKRRTCESDRAAVIKSVEEFGQTVTGAVVPVAKGMAGTPVGRCAGTIAAAVKESVDREISAAKAALASDLEELDRANKKTRARNRDVLEKLLRAHDLPDAEKTFEIVWTGNTVKATVRERTTFNVEAVLGLDLPPTSIFAPDLRVDRLVDGVELHAVEAGGWMKKVDKVVPVKLGRYFITRVAVGSDVTFRLQERPEASSLGFTITVRGSEPLLVERHGEGTKEFQIEESDKAKLCQLASKLAKETLSLDTSRGTLVTMELGGKPVAEHAHPRELAELLIRTIAPTVQKIAKHSRSPGELVLRRMLGGNRREELFMATNDLLQMFAHLPPAAREVFGPLELDGKPYVAPAKPAGKQTEPTPAAKPADAKPEGSRAETAKPEASKPEPTEAVKARVPTPDTMPRSSPTRPPVLTAPRLSPTSPPADVPASSSRMPVVTGEPATESVVTKGQPTSGDDEMWDERKP